ncbi:tRNA glutamyl-Q(34) synthetase GluQRS [Shewanella eurypsychrophilus]|uniref:Glutamyl-Q tRNA(Asp) synthetase n=1 Tax=Shewanella eurypsychrophilus TaxID=2593656 RepID=A0ABX6V2Z4_9GAMM|nr:MULTISPECIES: tRNA glutamyl-Q(34) synthetase GluQRS [Shewanella]QFU21368.1 tRNA glutamyl-Q(34) synthetase GluQRS [Shewanella sp. YLB-09]QPG56658.1 tRNA glutamyl-Q(34) synthetase GluQRS [Shewanella eurypsychrophilus]
MTLTNQTYIGRFAPSPSGPLHFGSLVAALGSYLRARKQGGQWLVRIEDIDPPREVPGSSDDILKTLAAYGLNWDNEILYQSSRLGRYQAKIDALIAQDKAYYCQCSRKQIKTMGGTYDGRCGRLVSPLTQGAIRIRNHVAIEQFDDLQMGQVSVDAGFAAEDFIIKRSDGLYAYQLAVVMDDAYQGITEVVRGSDLLVPTCRQIGLFKIFNQTAPTWLHLPLVCTTPGMKLSKQNHAAAIDKSQPQHSFNAALSFLGQASVTPEVQMSKMVAQAVSQFDLSLVPKQTEIILS